MKQKGSPTAKTVAVVQSSYIPWKGYFDLINLADEFILYDDVQYTRRDWRNRNRIKIAGGTTWLTIPVMVKGKFRQKVCEAELSDRNWAKKHWRSICQWYGKAPFFSRYQNRFEELYLGCREMRLSAVNHRFLRAICDLLGIRTTLSWSSDYRLTGDKTDRLVNLCRQAGATCYLSGPSARAYIDLQTFRDAGIQLTWMDYQGYPPYEQLFPPFIHEVSIIDLLFCKGPDAQLYMKSF